MVLGLDETPKGFTSQYDRSHPLEPDWTTPVQVGVERPHSRSFFRLGNFQAQIVSDVLQPCRFEVWVPQAADVGSPPGKTFVEYVADGTLTSPGGEAKEALKLNAACSYWMTGLWTRCIWKGGGWKLGFEDKDDKWGIILPQSLLWVPSPAARLKDLVGVFQCEKEPRRVRTESNGLCTTRLHDHRCQSCRFGRAVDLESHGRCAVWYPWCDGIRVDDAWRDEKRWDGLAFENGKDTRLVARSS